MAFTSIFFLALAALQGVSALLYGIYVPAWPGATVTLDEAGYEALKASQDETQMWRFIRRLLYAHGATVRDETALNAFVPKYIDRGDAFSLETFDTLIHALSVAPWIDMFSSSTKPMVSSKYVELQGRLPRMNLFIAGVEGSGHTSAMGIIDSCISFGTCMADPELSRSLWDYRDDKTALKSVWGAAATRELEEPTLGHQLRLLNAYGRANKLGELTFTGMMAYPSFSSYWYPRLETYAEVAKEFGDTVYALVMVRDPKSVLCSASERLGHDPRAEVAALHELVRQLRFLNPATFQCIDYDVLPEVGPDIGAFLSMLFMTRVNPQELVAKSFQLDPVPIPCLEINDEHVQLYKQAQWPLLDLCRQADAAKR